MNNESKEHIFFQVLIENKATMVTVPVEERISYVDPDDDFDFHAYRILLLLRVCGLIKEPFFSRPAIYGRRKFSFFDFLIRYPFFLIKAIEKSKKEYLTSLIELREYEKERVFSPMMRYIKGPWDHRYDSILNYMISKGLVDVKYDYFSKTQKAFIVTLTPIGMDKAEEIMSIEHEWVKRMNVINELFPKNSSNDLIEKYVQDKFPSLILGYGGVNDDVY